MIKHLLKSFGTSQHCMDCRNWPMITRNLLGCMWCLFHLELMNVKCEQGRVTSIIDVGIFTLVFAHCAMVQLFVGLLLLDSVHNDRTLRLRSLLLLRPIVGHGPFQNTVGSLAGSMMCVAT